MPAFCWRSVRQKNSEPVRGERVNMLAVPCRYAVFHDTPAYRKTAVQVFPYGGASTYLSDRSPGDPVWAKATTNTLSWTQWTSNQSGWIWHPQCQPQFPNNSGVRFFAADLEGNMAVNLVTGSAHGAAVPSALILMKPAGAPLAYSTVQLFPFCISLPAFGKRTISQKEENSFWKEWTVCRKITAQR